jgi:hypothetical protein
MTRNILPKSEEMQLSGARLYGPTLSSSSTMCPATNCASSSVNPIASRQQSQRKPSLLLIKKKSNSTQMSSDDDDQSAYGKNGSLDHGISDSRYPVTKSPSPSPVATAPMFQMKQVKISSTPPFAKYRLNQWHTNEEIFNILTQFSCLSSLIANSTKYIPEAFLIDEKSNEQLGLLEPAKLMNEWLTSQAVQRPKNGSVFIFDRHKVKNFKKDSYIWKRRKTGGANSVREDRMCLKVNGVDCIYGCYSHSSIMPTFHRRCYWLLNKPEIVLVHYLQTPNSETGESMIIFNANNLNNLSNSNSVNCYVNGNSNGNGSGNGSGVGLAVGQQDFQLSKEELRAELESMLWPYYLNQAFINENLKSILNVSSSASSPLSSSQSISISQTTFNSASEFIEMIVNRLIATNLNSQQQHQTQTIRINLLCNLNQANLIEILNTLPNLSNNISSNFCADKNTNDAYKQELNRAKISASVPMNVNNASSIYSTNQQTTSSDLTNIGSSSGGDEVERAYASSTIYCDNYKENQVHLSIGSCTSKVLNEYYKIFYFFFLLVLFQIKISNVYRAVRN